MEQAPVVIEERRGWHLLREIPVAMLAALILQSLGFAWWLSGLNSQVLQQSKDIAAVVVKIELISNHMHSSAVAMALHAARMVALEQQLGEMRARVNEDDRRDLRAQRRSDGR